MRLFLNPYHILVALAILTGCKLDDSKSSEEILKTFSIVDGFQIELVAMEPLISDPVAMEIDENGDMYVVEMHGYPLDKEGSGVVKRLYDDDNDGIMDRSDVFYDKLILPTGVMRWKKGILVTDPPDLLYLEDTDGDGRADKREVVITGFALSNPQHNFNNPVYGLDNWIYLANEGTYKSKGFEDLFNDEGSEIFFPNHPEVPRLPKNANDLNVKVDINNQKLEMLSGDSQYGHTFDQWGHHFGTRNWSHIYHEVLDAEYIKRNQDLQISTSMQYVPDYGIGFELFPITHNPEHQLLTDVGAVTSSCGITWYQGDLFPDPFHKVVFIAEPTHNLVHSDIIYNKGATFGSKSQFEGKEFLASTDGWFRPVNFYIGPDGALYLLDFHRKIIEHPEWISEEVLNSGDLYQGIDKGRIYKIVPTGSTPISDIAKLAEASPELLIQYLESPNIWFRRNAQRLLVDAAEDQTVGKLKSFVRSSNQLGVLHGLWTLDGLGVFYKELIQNAFSHSSEGVRENAIRIAELHRSEFQDLEKQLISMINDPDPKVRFQLLCTLGHYNSSEAANARNSLLFADIDDPWMQLAAMSATDIDWLTLYEQATVALNGKKSEGTISFFENLGQSIGKRGNLLEINKVLKMCAGNFTDDQNWWKVATMKGLAKNDLSMQGLDRQSLTSLWSLFKENTDKDLRSSGLNLLSAVGYFNELGDKLEKVKMVTTSPRFSPAFRADAVKVLAWNDPDSNLELIQTVFVSSDNLEIREAGLWAMEQTSNDDRACSFLVGQWVELSPDQRELAIDIFMVNDQRRLLLLEAIGSGQIQASNLSWSRTVSLLNSRSDAVRKLARNTLEGNESVSDTVWLEYQKTLVLSGNVTNGSNVFETACASCHQISESNGVAYGPDLSAVRNRSKSGIMIDILKPNKSISDGYDLWTIEDNSGNHYAGIIVNESANSILLRDASGNEVLIQRTDIKSRLAAEISAMPEGLHRQISHQEMADLLEYLKSGS